MFKNKAGADESVHLAADYVKEHLSKLLTQKPEIIEGQSRLTIEEGEAGSRLNRKRRSRSLFVIGCSLIGVYLHLGGKRDMG